MGIKIVGIKASINNITKSLNKAIETELRERALKAFAEVKLQTPVDQGRARNSWYIGYQTEFKDAAKEAVSVQIIAPQDKPKKIIITNGVTYIEFLNEGHSSQAPSKFIESVFKKYFDDVNVEIINNRE